MTDTVQVDVRSGVMTIRMNRPDKKNALTQAMYASLAEALVEADERDDVRALLLTGTADCFTAGNDLRDFLDDPPLDPGAPVHRFLEALSGCRTPLVAAVNGPAVGIGTTMLLHCDLVYAAESAVLRLPFVDLGLVPEAGSSLLLPLLVGSRRAAELLLLGDPFDAATAARYGIVNRVHPDDEVLERAREVATRLAAKPPEALRLTRALLREGLDDALGERIQKESRLLGQRLRSPESREAMQAFLGL